MLKQPNRIAALSGAAASVAAVLLAVLGAVDSTPKALVVVAAILGIAIVVVVFLLGSQRWEALIFRDARGTPDQTVQVTTDQAPTPGDHVEGLASTPHPLTAATTNSLTAGPTLPEGENPDPIDAQVDARDLDDPLLTDLLDPDHPLGQGYVYGPSEVPPPDESDAKVKAYTSPDAPGEATVDPIPKEG